MKVAYFSPMPPEQLRDRRLLGAPRAGAARARRRRGRAARAQAAPARVDLAVYHIGNNPDAHGWILDALRRTPGLVVLHDFVLHHLVAGMTIGRGRRPRLPRRDGAGARGRRAAARRTACSTSGCRRCGRPGRRTSRSRARCSRSRRASSCTRATSPTARGRRASTGRSARPAPGLAGARRRARRRRGRPADRRVRERQREQARAAAPRGVRAPAPERPGARLLLVGAISPGFDLDRRLQRLGLDGDGLVREGYVDERRLWSLMAACDVHVNLRSPTMGETSGTAIRALSLGKPLVVTRRRLVLGAPGRRRPQGARRRPRGRRARAPRSRLLATRPDVRAAMGAAARRARRGDRTTSAASPSARPPRSSWRRAGVRRGRGAAGGERGRGRASASRRARPRPRRSPGGSPRSTSVAELARRLARVPAWAWLAAIVVVSAVAPRLARARHAGAVRVRRRADLLRSWREASPTTGGVRRPRAADERLQPALPGADRTCVLALRRPADRLRGGQGDRTRSSMSLAAIPAFLIARRVRGRGSSLLAAVLAVALPVDRVHGDDHDREPLLPGRARRRVVAPARARAAGVAARRARSPSARRRARDALAGARVRRRRSRLAPARAGARRARPRGCSARSRPCSAPSARSPRSCSAPSSARGRSLADLLGAYSVVGEGGYDVGDGAALLALARRGADAVRRRRPDGRADRPRRARPAAPGPAAGARRRHAGARRLVAPSPSARSPSRFASDRVQDRYLFFLAPLLLVALLGWVAIGAPRPRVPLVGRQRSSRVGAVARVPVHAVHRRAGEVGHARADAALDGERAPPRRLVLGHRARRRAALVGALRCSCRAAARGRGAARPPRALRRALAPRLVGAARLAARPARARSSRGSAASTATGSTRRARRRRGRGALDRPRRPLHGQP